MLNKFFTVLLFSKHTVAGSKFIFHDKMISTASSSKLESGLLKGTVLPRLQPETWLEEMEDDNGTPSNIYKIWRID